MSALDVERLCAAARSRLEQRAGLASSATEQYRLPPERPFTAAERDHVTILFGGLTERHEQLIQATFESCGYRAQRLPPPDLGACLVGKQYCNNGVCNPAYFTIGNLIKFLLSLEQGGLSRQEICDRYVFFTAGNCGPCRFGMYEAEYRLGLRNAGFEGFRVLTFQQNHGVKADTGQSGLKPSLNLGLGAFNAFHLADALNGFGYEVRPFERVSGQTDARLVEALELAAAALRERPDVDAREVLPGPLWTLIRQNQRLARAANILVRIRDHVHGPLTRQILDMLRETLASIEVDRLRVKPVVKVTGEFWAQTTEGDGNFRMFAFLEQEGAHVVIEPIGGWVLYLLNQARTRALDRRGFERPRGEALWRRWVARHAEARRRLRTLALFGASEHLYRRQYDRVCAALGNLPHTLADQEELAQLAHPFYHRLARGGEGHLEVAKSIYYTQHGIAHLILSLKPFGCMPSTQSDAVQSALAAQMKDLLFLSVETAADGELAAHSRVQMALLDARARAQAEFSRALATTGRSVEEIRDFVSRHPELRHVFHRVPRVPGVAGTAARFALHVHALMEAERGARTSLVPARAAGGERR